MTAITTPLVHNSSMLTQIELLHRLDPKGNIAQIAEVLNETNEVIDDIDFREGNLPVGDEQTIRTGLPKVYFRQYNRGVPPSHSTTAKVTETCSQLYSRSQIDASVVNLNGLTAQFRKSEERPFIEAMGQQFANEMFYGNPKSTGEGFLGLSSRYSTLSTSKAACAKNVIDCGGTGSKLTSIWVIGWGDDIYCPYPKGSILGLQSVDYGKILVPDDAGNLFPAYVTDYYWDVGLMVRDWSYAVRLCNINPDDLLKGTGIGAGDIRTAGSMNLLMNLNLALSKIPHTSNVKLAMYMNSDVYAGLLNVATRTNINVVTFDKGANGISRATSGFYQSTVIRQCDCLVNTEAQVK